METVTGGETAVAATLLLRAVTTMGDGIGFGLSTILNRQGGGQGLIPRPSGR